METTHISALNAKHAGLDARIRIESARPFPDSLLVATLKKRKLAIKQEIALLHG
ncbi:YdcH family protein [Sphingobium sp. CR28]|uniref:YdcH family protein n=1 Tax=Sphingobium sp. CR28 TaxID=3400272 RepID=UPI003FF12DAC